MRWTDRQTDRQTAAVLQRCRNTAITKRPQADLAVRPPITAAEQDWNRDTLSVAETDKL